MARVDRGKLQEMMDGHLAWEEIKDIITAFKDQDRFAHYISILQQRVSWSDRILLALGPHLFIVVDADKQRVVKCDCGHVFGDYRRNWKLSALINVRDTEAELHEIYPRLMGPDPDWQVIREYICPGCGVLLEVETAPPWYPVIFDFLPDLDAFYKGWLKNILADQSAASTVG